MTTLSTQRTAHALRHFTIGGALWAIYGPNATPAGAIFSGYALSLGLKESQIAFLVGLAALVGLWELFTFWASGPLTRRRWLLVGWGTVEITCGSVAVFATFLPHHRFLFIAIFLAASYLIGHTISPTFNSWLSKVMPEEVRARYIGGRMFAVSVTAMVYLFLASNWLDWQGKSYAAFLTVFIVGWLGGVLGYWILLITPMPAMAEAEERPSLGSLLRPFHNRPFRMLALYLISWTVASGLASAFYGVYMIKYLKLPYGTIAVYTNITLALMMAGYLAAGNITQRYGSKPLTQILIIPAAAVPALWAFTSNSNYQWIIPIAAALSGVCASGLTIAASNLLYKILPRGENNSVYFATWGAAAAGGAAVGPFVGGLLRSRLPEQMILGGGLEFTTLQAIFLLSAVMHLVAIFLSNLLAEGEATSPIYLLGQFRGNLLNMAYGYGLYAVARKNETRGEAMRRLGQSRSPLAVDHLVKGLEHVSREVRVGAVKGLGDGRFAEAVEPLVQELTDKESDIRAEAAEALGKIGAAHGHLYEALYDDDPRVRMSAAMGLSALLTSESKQALLEAIEEALQEPFDRNLFPTLVEAAARGEDLRLIEPALAGLAKLTAPVVRMQVINSICQVIGEKNHFYRLATADDLAQGRMREKMMARIRRLLGKCRYGTGEERSRLRQLGQQIEQALDADDLATFAAGALDVSELTMQMTSVPSVPLHAAHAIRLYLAQERPEQMEHELIVFVTVCLTSLARNLAA